MAKTFLEKFSFQGIACTIYSTAKSKVLNSGRKEAVKYPGLGLNSLPFQSDEPNEFSPAGMSGLMFEPLLPIV